MTTSEQPSAFEIVLASTVHDMKNSIGMLLSAIDRISSTLDEAIIKERVKDFNVVQYEAKRTNNALVKLLSLYKMEKQKLPLNFEYYFLDEFIAEQLSEHQTLFESKNLELEIDIEEDLEWCFDESLISSVMNDVITNTIRYTKNTIKVSATTVNKMLCIEIADDGSGYPDFMTQNPDSYVLGVDFSSGSTGLGLYFAANVAKLHKSKDKVGRIDLKNGGELGGGIFQIFLP